MLCDIDSNLWLSFSFDLSLPREDSRTVVDKFIDPQITKKGWNHPHNHQIENNNNKSNQ